MIDPIDYQAAKRFIDGYDVNLTEGQRKLVEEMLRREGPASFITPNGGAGARASQPDTGETT